MTDPRLHDLYDALIGNVAHACPTPDIEELQRAAVALTSTMIETFKAMGPDNVPLVSATCACLGGTILTEVMAHHEAVAAEAAAQVDAKVH